MGRRISPLNRRGRGRARNVLPHMDFAPRKDGTPLPWRRTAAHIHLTPATVMTELRLVLRLLRRSPGFAAAAILCLAVGLGATTAAFSVLDAVALRPIPFPDAERLVDVH